MNQRLKEMVSSVLLASMLSIAGLAQAGGIRTVALSGQQAPGLPSGVSYDSIDNLWYVLNDAGQTAFLATYADSSSNVIGAGLWAGTSGSLALVAGSSVQAPGTPSGVTFNGFGKIGIDQFGRAALSAALAGPGVDTNNETNSQGIWAPSTSGLALAARAGNQAAGLPSGVIYGAGSPDPFSLVTNKPGQVAFYSYLNFNYTYQEQGLWSGAAGSLRLVARTGNQIPDSTSHAPGTPSGVNFSTFTSPVLNDAGETAFVGGLTGTGISYNVNDVGIWSEGSGSLALVARAGNHAPGTASGVNYGSGFFPPALNNAGHIAFAAILTGSGVDNTNFTGLWSGDSTGPALVARGGSQAPGTPSGVKFRDFYTSQPVLNNADQIAVWTFLTGAGVDSTNDEGIWLENSGALALMARSGSHAPGTPSGVNYEYLTQPDINDAGQIAFAASLTGSGVNSTNDSGIWVTDTAGVLELIAREGDLLEVAPGDFRTIASLSLNGLLTGNSDGRGSDFNNAGQLAFWASFTDGSEGIFVSNAVATPEPAALALLSIVLPALFRRYSRTRK